MIKGSYTKFTLAIQSVNIFVKNTGSQKILTATKATDSCLCEGCRPIAIHVAVRRRNQTDAEMVTQM